MNFKLADSFAALLLFVGCGLDQRDVESEGRQWSPAGETSGGGAAAGDGDGDGDAATGGRLEPDESPKITRQMCLDAARDDGFLEAEADMICGECLALMEEECPADPERCFMNVCDAQGSCPCSATLYCAEDSLREAGMGMLFCEFRSTDEVDCAPSQRLCAEQGGSEECVCDLFRPASKSDCEQHVDFICYDGDRDCICSAAFQDLGAYDCSQHAALKSEFEGMAYQCELECPGDDLSAHQCDCRCSP